MGDPEDPIATRDRVGEVRAEELREAGRRMGLASVTVLDWGDGGMSGDRGLPGAEHRAVEDSILAWLHVHPLDVLITWGPDGGYRHPDHIATGERCVAALEHEPALRPAKVYRMVAAERVWSRVLKRFPEWDLARTFTPWKDEDLGAVVTLSDDELTKKWHAMQAHRTQLPDLRRYEQVVGMDPEAGRVETFVRWWPPQQRGRVETDLF